MKINGMQMNFHCHQIYIMIYCISHIYSYRFDPIFPGDLLFSVEVDRTNNKKFDDVFETGWQICLVSHCRTMQWFYGTGHICCRIMTGVSQMEHEACAYLSVGVNVCVCLRACACARVFGRGN